jgi:hypothetical protein
LNLHALFQWHKLLHFILPIIIILILQKRFKLLKICLVIFIIGFLKEVYDVIVKLDPLWMSAIDLVSDIVGITSGIIVSKIKLVHK